MWGQSNAIRAWDWSLFDWSRWFDVHTEGPQAGYAGIRILRPDVLAWYQKQGPERPIYVAGDMPSVRAARSFPRAEMLRQFPRSVGRYGCQLDYMMALAISEGVDRIIFHGTGQPYVANPNEPAARKWWARHASVLWWMGLAEARGIELVYDGPCMNRPFDGDYGYDMGPGGQPHGMDVER